MALRAVPARKQSPACVTAPPENAPSRSPSSRPNHVTPGHRRIRSSLVVRPGTGFRQPSEDTPMREHRTPRHPDPSCIIVTAVLGHRAPIEGD